MKKRIEYEKGDKIGSCFYLEDVSKVGRMRIVLFACECGNIFTTYLKNVKSGNTKSCGCFLDKKRKVGLHFIHGQSGKNTTPEYRAYKNMMRRCYEIKRKEYTRYGGRGIEVCERWRESFIAFFEDMGSRPSKKHSLDRIENDKGYFKENCRWATSTEQIRNRSISVNIIYNGETKSLKEWCDILGIAYKQTHKRIFSLGWTIPQSLETPFVRGNQWKFKDENN